jgi:hypothetical protein
MHTATYALPRSMTGCCQHLAAILFMNFCQQGCTTLDCTASKTKGGCQSTIVLPMVRSSLLTTSRNFLDANLRRVEGESVDRSYFVNTQVA